MSLPTVFHHRSPSKAGPPAWLLKLQPPPRLTPKKTWILPAIFTAISIVALVQHSHRYPSLFPLLPPNEYRATLRSTIDVVFPAHMKPGFLEALDNRLHRKSDSGISNKLFQTDKAPPSAKDNENWMRHGFDPIFYNDDQGAKWVEETFANSKVARVFRELPLPILKADMIRYLLLLTNGGVYSDVDTRPIMNMSQWATGVENWTPAMGPRYPVRMIVGIEGDLHIWRNWESFFQGIGLIECGRHRPLQFTQWTIGAQASHPILIDTVRRIIDTSTLAHAWNITHRRQIEALEAANWRAQAAKVMQQKKPWDGDKKGQRLSVQEWTGPAAFTDAVLSYLLATAGVREKDLYGLDHPVQVGDVLVLPVNGFNPTDQDLSTTGSRSIHMFRGSWRKPPS